MSDPREGPETGREGYASGIGSKEEQPVRGPETVSRAAYLGGLAVGVGIAALGFSLLAMAKVSGVMSYLLEFLVVGAAILATTAVWRKSAPQPDRSLDSHGERPDRSAGGGSL